MKRKCYFLLILATAFAYRAFAKGGTGRIAGVIRDAQNTALAGATVILQNEGDTTTKTNRIADASAAFAFDHLPNGIYRISCTHIGFQTYRLNHLIIDNAHPAITLPALVLQASGSQSLKEVAIISKKPLIEQQTDRTIVNVDAMISAAGSSALEALGKSPGVYVDQNGNIELNGQGGVLVLIDDRPTYLSAQDLAAYLRSLPASLLDKIELMSNPPARYDASGRAVINLQLKKNRTAGFNGNVSLGYTQGFYARSNDALNINYRAKKFNIFANLSYSRDANYTNDKGTRDFYDNDGALRSTIRLNSRYVYSSDSWNGRAGMDYFASSNTTLGFVLTGGTRPRTDLLNSTAGQYNAAGQLDSTSSDATSGTYHWKSGGANLNFQHKFDNKGQQLNATMDYIRYQSDGSQLSSDYNYNAVGNLTSANAILNQTPSDIHIYAVKTDYTLPLPGKAELDAGLKSSLVNTGNQNNWFSQAGGLFVPDLANTNHFIYKENINAAYISAKKEWRRWGVQAGLRMENTHANGHQIGNSAVPDSSFTKSYTNLFPSLFLSHKLDSMGDNSLVLSYSIRVRRPNYQHLDPFLSYQNPYTYTAGNPYLDPHYNHILQLKYAYKQYFGFSLVYLHIDHIIYNITQNVGHVFITRPENFGINNSINLNAYANISPLKNWDLNANVLVYNLTNKGKAFGQVVDGNHTTGEIELSNQFQFSHGWSAELNYFYHGPGNGGQSTSTSIWTSSAGIQKNILRGNGTIRLKADNIFHSLKDRSTLITSGSTYIHTSESDTRLIGLSLSYRFGKDANARKRNDNGSAEDEKGRTN
jgi:hypothetical protein